MLRVEESEAAIPISKGRHRWRGAGRRSLERHSWSGGVVGPDQCGVGAAGRLREPWSRLGGGKFHGDLVTELMVFLAFGGFLEALSRAGIGGLGAC